ncbi:MAG: hypothetical protein IT565_07865 [Rhodospirillales bacterium]|nr:hypothetical protein [Rhodospirillales bacterium]
MPTILVSLSAHGYGHAAMMAPIINTISSLNNNIKFVIQSSIPAAWLRTRIQANFQLIENKYDFGLVMNSAVTVDRKASARAYRDLHARWQDRIVEQVEVINKVNPTIVLSNISYLTLAAAARAKTPSIAASSLNWLEIYRSYLDGGADARRIQGEMLDAYKSASEFLIFTPGLPMDNVPNTRLLGPSARLGVNQRHRLSAISKEDRLGMVAFGGIATRLPVEGWRSIPGWRFLVPPEWNLATDRLIPWDRAGQTFVDLSASVDAVITKPGYGTFTEAACNGTAVLAQERPDWPETPYFESWMAKNARFLTAPERTIQSGDLADVLDALLHQPRPPVPKPSGVAEASEIILKTLSKQLM